MGALPRLLELILGTLCDDLLPPVNMVLQSLLQGQHARLVAVYQRQHVYPERGLHGSILVEQVEHLLRLGFTLQLFAALHLVFTPPRGANYVAAGDYLRLLAFALMLVGAWRAIRSSELGRAIAEERARVAREIHDGLAQYLFAVTTHVSMLESGADQAETLPRLKEAALAAQQEARFAVLALSSAAGSAPFDAALRRVWGQAR